MRYSGVRAQRSLAVLLLLASMFFFTSGLARRQAAPAEPSREHHGSIAGKVIDTSGKPIPKALVKLTDSVTEEVSTYKSGKNGEYKIINLVPGVYTLQAEAKGQQSDLSNVKVSNDVVTRQDLKVEPKK